MKNIVLLRYSKLKEIVNSNIFLSKIKKFTFTVLILSKEETDYES